MDQSAYRMLRAFCVEEIGEHIPKLDDTAGIKAMAREKGFDDLSVSELMLALDNAVAHDLLGLSGERVQDYQSELAPRELAAAQLLKVCSGARLHALNHEKFGQNTETENLVLKAGEAVRQAIAGLAPFLSKKKTRALLGLFDEVPATRAQSQTRSDSDAAPLLPENTPAPSQTPNRAPAAQANNPAPGWQLKKPERFSGYRLPLFNLLEEAHRQGRDVPKAADVFLAWKTDPPSGYGIEVADNLCSMTYHADGKHPIKKADSEAVSKSIKRLIQE